MTGGEHSTPRLKEASNAMLKSLTLENFKSFGAEQTIPFAPVTLLYGPNSAGKSSIIQALLLLKQSHGDVPYYGLELRGELVDLGDWMSLIHRHDASRTLRVKLEWTCEPRPWDRPEDELDGTYPPASLEFRRQYASLGPEMAYEYREAHKPLPTRGSEIAWSPCVDLTAQRRVPNNERSGSAPWCHARFDASADDCQESTISLRAARGEWAKIAEVNQAVLPPHDAEWWHRFLKHQYDPHRFDLVRTSAESHELWSVVRRLMAEVSLSHLTEPGATFPPYEAWSGCDSEGELDHADVPEAAWNAAGRRQAELSLQVGAFLYHYKECLDGIRHLGPVRELPERLYTRPPRRAKMGTLSDELQSLQKEVNYWLRRMDVPYRIRVSSLRSHLGHVASSIQVQDATTGARPALRDVGFGVSQLLPILVAARGTGAVCVEQPELHLHPKLQGHLGDLFLDTSRKGSNGNQWIVETHSEALMLRIQRRVREGKFQAADVCVLYVEPSKSGARVTQLRLDDRGEFIDEWPGGFFEQSLADIVPIRDWAQRRKRGK